MDVNKVLDAFFDMANISESEKSKYLPMANVAINQVEARCKKSVNEKDIPVLTMLCAAMINLWISLSKANSDPTGIDYPIPANDDAIKSVKLILEYFAAAIKEGKAKATK